jgi:hypothetical protein
MMSSWIQIPKCKEVKNRTWIRIRNKNEKLEAGSGSALKGCGPETLGKI